VLEGEHGFFHAYSPAPRPQLVLKDLGQRWLLHDITIKAYPCHVSFQAVVDAIQRYRAAHPFNAGDVERVVIRGTGRFFEERFGERQPTTLMGAQYSLPWSAALALTRDVADPRTWSADDLRDEELGKLAQQIELEEGPLSGPKRGDGEAAHVAELTLTAAGAEHRLPITDWKGAPTNRCTMHDVAAKLRLYAEPYLEQSEADKIVERVAALEGEADVAGLARTIRGAEVRA
jgi:2-methylcitrate dehydratase PrpD